MDSITQENAKNIRKILLNNCIEDNIIELEYKYLNAKLKIDNATICEKSEIFENMDEFYFINDRDNLENNKLCLDIKNKKYMLFMNVGKWAYDYRIKGMHLSLGSTYNFGSSKYFFSQMDLSQALEDDNYLYIAKNLTKLAGNGSISRINSGLKSDRNKKIERRNRLVKRLNGEIVIHNGDEWLVVSKISKGDLMNEENYNDIFYNLVRNILNYSLIIEDIIAEDKLKNR
ncbi:hypothetical protein G6Y98_06090 [Clostridium perfringens]|uniref:hypothetical protein n=1 Tax=Clostridium perfringens TaxID=1502 RepID=UPI0013E2EBB4|nr:hypothetical protein [Clostridium perfringens]EGT3605498.1 hypothetical protein [Clostridium perfringens]NGT57823.1 hypothetical protein [Clostridium perfringens]NGT95366.1 hypothetical protein [Clostridium perfringens]